MFKQNFFNASTTSFANLDTNQTTEDERDRNSRRSSKADSSTEYLDISSCDLSNENKVINLLKQVGDKNSNETSTNMLFEIKKLRIRDPNKIIFGNSNINSLPNKFEQLKDTVMQHIDIHV